MKTILLLLLSVLLVYQINYGQTPATPDAIKPVANVEIKIVETKTAGAPDVTTKTTTTVEKSKEETINAPQEKGLTNSKKGLVLLPVLLFLLCLFITFLFAKKSGVDFKHAFYSEKPEDKIMQTDPINNPSQTITITVLDANGLPVFRPSVSRIIVFLSGLTTLGVVVCFVSYNAYCMVKGIPLPCFKNLFEIIIGLGLGIIPYGFNKITTTTK